jgi:hypothetical protein
VLLAAALHNTAGPYATLTTVAAAGADAGRQNLQPAAAGITGWDVHEQLAQDSKEHEPGPARVVAAVLHSSWLCADHLCCK